MSGCSLAKDAASLGGTSFTHLQALSLDTNVLHLLDQPEVCSAVPTRLQ